MDVSQPPNAVLSCPLEASVSVNSRRSPNRTFEIGAEGDLPETRIAAGRAEAR
jgi:hypothetical protein